MAPSTFWISMSVFLISWYWALLFALDPLRQMSADLNKVNEILLLFHDIVLTYCLPFLMEISSASRPWYLRHSLPIRPAVVITQGVNVLCSMSRTLLECQYRRFFPFSCINRSVAVRGPCTIRHVGDRPWHQRMSIVGAPRIHVHGYPISQLVLILDPLLSCSPEMS